MLLDCLLVTDKRWIPGNLLQIPVNYYGEVSQDMPAKSVIESPPRKETALLI